MTSSVNTQDIKSVIDTNNNRENILLQNKLEIFETKKQHKVTK